MTVHFIGAGPGAPDLITLRGLKLIQSCPVCLYAGSLVPEVMISEAPKHARIINTATLNLDEIIAEMQKAHQEDKDVARLHSGDPSLYGAIDEQMRRLDELSIPYDITPGVPAFAAAAAILKKELTIPSLNQSVILTRTSVQSSAMPEGETLTNLGAARATMVVHLSVKNIKKLQADLLPLYGADCPVIVAARIGWPDQRILQGTLKNIDQKLSKTDISRTALIFIGRSLDAKNAQESALYSKGHKSF